MEKDFLLYSMFIAFIELRVRAYENNDDYSIKLCNLMHSIPLTLIGEIAGKQAYERFLEKIKEEGREDWLKNRENEFQEYLQSIK